MKIVIRLDSNDFNLCKLTPDDRKLDLYEARGKVIAYYARSQVTWLLRQTS